MSAGLLAGPLSRPINSCISALGDWIDMGTRSSELLVRQPTFIDEFNGCGSLSKVEASLKHFKLWGCIFCGGDIHFKAPDSFHIGRVRTSRYHSSAG